MGKQSCPNPNSPEWKNLVAELNNSRLDAMEAFRKNNYEIPDINDPIVKEIKKSVLNFGPKVEVILDDEGKQTNKYIEVDENGKKKSRTFERISKFVPFFSAKKVDRTKSFAQKKGEKLWGSIPVDDKLVTPEFGVEQTMEQYIAALEKIQLESAAKGNIIHFAIKKRVSPGNADKLQTEIDSIIEEFENEKGILPFNWKWIEKPGVIETIFDHVGINYFKELDAIDEFLRDELFSEVSVASKELGLAGTVDMLVKHSDNKYSIIDWKTGKSMNSFYTGLNNVLMKYGSQGVSEIEDSLRNRAKLQIALYAVILRSQNPNMKFRQLNLSWIPSEYNALDKDPDMSVDVMSYIPMIEQFLSDPVLLKEAGLPIDIRAKLLEKDPDIFSPKIYSDNASSGLVSEMLSSTKTPQEHLADKLAKLQHIVGKNLKYEKLSKEDKEIAVQLQKDIQHLTASPGVVVKDSQFKDMSNIEYLLGNYSEVSHPMVQAWKKFKDEQIKKSYEASERKIEKYRSLLRPVLKEFEKENNVKNILGNKAYDYDKIYGRFFIDESINEETNQMKERLVTNTEEEGSAAQKQYDSLSKAEKNLINYVNETFSSYFNGQDAFLNQTATVIEGINVGHLELFNKKKKKKDTRGWHKGFFFKVPPTDEDIILRNGGGNYLKGKFSKRTFQSLLYRYATFFRENSYEGWNDKNQALPVKFLGNDFIDSSKAYTRNLDIIFSEAIRGLEYKRHMDGVYSMGTVLKARLEAEEDGELYPNLIKFLDIKLQQDIQGKIKLKQSKARGIRLPMKTPNGVQQEKVSLDAVVKALTKWTSMNTMWLRPWQGIGNGVHAMLLTHRDGLKGSISGIKLFGISGNAIDYTYIDIAKAEAEYVRDYLGSAVKGNFRKSKMYLLAKEFNYFGDNFDYAGMEKNLLSKRNRFMSESSMYLFHSLPEEFVSMTTMTAQLMHLKNEVTGKSLYDSYETEELLDENGKGTGEWVLKWTGGVRGKIIKSSGSTQYTETLTGLDATEQAKIRKVHERLQGGYRKDEATILEFYAAGKLFIQLKKYFPRLLLNAVHNKRLETDLGYYKKLLDKDGNPVYEDENGKPIPVYEWVARMTEGRFRTLIAFVFRLMSAGYFNNEYAWEKLADEQKMNLVEAVLTLGILMGMYAMYLQMFGHLDDDDATKKWWKMYLVDNLSQQYNFVDLARTIKTIATPVAFAKASDFVVNGSLMIFSGANYAIGNEDEALTKKGDLRGWNNFAKTIPLISSYKDVYRKLTNTKDPESIINILMGDMAPIRYK